MSRLPPTFARCDRAAVLFSLHRWRELGSPARVTFLRDARDLLVCPALDGRGLWVGSPPDSAEMMRVQKHLRDILPGIYRSRIRELGVCRALAILGCGADRAPTLTLENIP